MQQSHEATFKMQPVISCPVRAQIGKKYLLSVDVECPDFPSWPYESEEHVLYCLVESRPLFTCQPMGDSALVVHRFGGTFGPVQFILTAAARELIGSLRITLVNGHGMPVRTVEVRDVQVTRVATRGKTVSVPVEPVEPPASASRPSRQRAVTELLIRVRIEYQVETYGSPQKVELPFVMGVMSDLSGRRREALPRVAERKFQEIDIDNFDDHLKACRPEVAFRVPNTLTGDGYISVAMSFESMDDFSPAGVVRKLEYLSNLLRARTELTKLLTYMDGKAKAEELIGKLLSNPNLLRSVASATSSESGQA